MGASPLANETIKKGIERLLGGLWWRALTIMLTGVVGGVGGIIGGRWDDPGKVAGSVIGVLTGFGFACAVLAFVAARQRLAERKRDAVRRALPHPIDVIVEDHLRKITVRYGDGREESAWAVLTRSGSVFVGEGTANLAPEVQALVPHFRGFELLTEPDRRGRIGFTPEGLRMHQRAQRKQERAAHKAKLEP